MKSGYVAGVIALTFIIENILAAPPNVIEMRENERVVDQLAPNKEKIDVKEPEKLLAVDDLKPPDHLDAVKLEQDGMINKDYKKEIFLGNHEEIEDDNYEVAESKLKDIFMK